MTTTDKLYALFCELERVGIFDVEITPTVQSAIRHRIYAVLEDNAKRIADVYKHEFLLQGRASEFDTADILNEVSGDENGR